MNDLKNTNSKIFPKHGVTLIELLVVSAVMVLLMSVSLPVLNVMSDARLARDTAQGVVTTLETARRRAMQIGRPCGVEFQPFHEDYPFVCIQLNQLTARTTYVGTYTNNGGNITIQPPSGITLHKGDVVQLDFCGPKFVISRDGQSTINLVAWKSYKDTDGNVKTLKYSYDNFNTEGDTHECVITTFPTSETTNPFARALGIVSSYIPPKGYIVDLRYSQYDYLQNDKTIQFVDNYPTYAPKVIFNPDGSAVFYKNGTPYGGFIDTLSTSSNKICILIGKWDQMATSGGSISEEGLSNDKDYDSYWVVINPKNGRITMARNSEAGLTTTITNQ